MRTLIVGPCTGIPEWNRPAFDAAERQLRLLNMNVVNPAKFFAGDVTQPWADYMHLSLREILAARVDSVIMLPGWENSKGAKIEVAVAREMNINTVPLETVLANACLT